MRLSEETLIYFSPETARVRFPIDLMADLAAKVAEYQRLKSALKSELRDRVRKTRRRRSGPPRQARHGCT
jgi:hypothetical protein